MNKEPTLFNYILYFLAFYFVTAAQTSLWYQWLGNFPSPLLWLILITYITMYRSFWVSLIMCYSMAVALSTMSATGVGFIILNILFVYAILWYLKHRIFWPGYRYFLIANVLSLISYQLINLFLIRWADGEITDFNFLTRLGQVLITTIFIFPLYQFLNWLDNVSMKEIKTQHHHGVEL